MTEPAPHVGLTEIAQILGVKRQRAYVLAKRKDFPAPVTATKAGRAWKRADIEKWEATWDRTPGRPRKQPPVG